MVSEKNIETLKGVAANVLILVLVEDGLGAPRQRP